MSAGTLRAPWREDCPECEREQTVTLLIHDEAAQERFCVVCGWESWRGIQ